jgi:hypothetical protein
MTSCLILDVALAVEVKNDFEIFLFITEELVKFQIFWKLMRSQIPEDFHIQEYSTILFFEMRRHTVW